MGNKSKKGNKRDYTSSILSNVMCNFSSQRVLLVVSDIVNIIIVIVGGKNILIIVIVGGKNVLIVIAYKLKYLCNNVIYITNMILEFLNTMLIMPFKAFQDFLGANILLNKTTQSM